MPEQRGQLLESSQTPNCYVIGDTVPWNTLWSAEREITVKPCELAEGAPATWQRSAQGVGKPVFKTQHHVRQRMCVRLLLCSVCGNHTPPEDRLFFPMRLDEEPDRIGAWLMTEAPVHRSCAEHAMTACPFLRQKQLPLLEFPEQHDYEIVPVWRDKNRNVVKFLAFKFSWRFVRETIAPAL